MSFLKYLIQEALKQKNKIFENLIYENRKQNSMLIHSKLILNSAYF